MSDNYDGEYYADADSWYPGDDDYAVANCVGCGREIPSDLIKCADCESETESRKMEETVTITLSREDAELLRDLLEVLQNDPTGAVIDPRCLEDCRRAWDGSIEAIIHAALFPRLNKTLHPDTDPFEQK